MIQKFRFGNPFPTDAVIVPIAESTGEVPYFTVESKESIQFLFSMGKKDIVYGLGETVRGINKRGWIYESNCSDDPNHEEHKHSLYGAHNFLCIEGEKTCFGVFFDYPGKLTFDIGYTDPDLLCVSAEEADMDVYVIEEDTPEAIVKEFRRIIGRSYIPPKWAFGFGQSRWSYMSEDEIREVVANYRNAGIPLDSVYLDIDYMDHYKDFTLNEDTFPAFPAFVKEMETEGIHLVPIIDAGVKIEEGYDICEEGKKEGYFCKDEDGEDFVAAVWPGRAYFPDFLNRDVRRWFGHQYKFLLDQGIEGFWNDMNEPAIFYTEKHLQEVFEELEQFKGKNLELSEFNKFRDLFSQISNRPEDYRSFYHNVNGKQIRHDKVHNLYGYNMTRAAGEAFEELEPDKRILMYSRSSYVGMHRYGGIWMGDNFSWWQHILLNLKMLPSLNMVGILYTGADIGGFSGDTTEDLVLRWTALGIFTPLMRNHSAMGTRRQEVYRFKNREAFKNLIGIRYGLLPYLYSEFVKAALHNEMLFKPLAFEYREDSFATQVEDQLLLGESLMIAPVYTQNAEGRYVYLPEEMKLIRMRSMEDYEEEILPKGHHYVPVALQEVIFFIRPDRIVPICKPASCIRELDEDTGEVLAFIKTEAVYELYTDDGFTKDYENPKHWKKISMQHQHSSHDR